MNVTKKVVGELKKCYALTMLNYHGHDHFLVAAEKVNECRLYDLDGNQEEVLWSEPGGIMTMQQVPGSDGQFLSTRKFYSPNDSKNASIVVVTPMGKNDWRSPGRVCVAELPDDLSKFTYQNQLELKTLE